MEKDISILEAELQQAIVDFKPDTRFSEMYNLGYKTALIDIRVKCLDYMINK